jgi:hypothetical protein
MALIHNLQHEVLDATHDATLLPADELGIALGQLFEYSHGHHERRGQDNSEHKCQPIRSVSSALKDHVEYWRWKDGT